MKLIGLLRENTDFAGIYPVSAPPDKSAVRCGTVRFDGPEVRRKVRRVFWVDLAGMNVTVHRGDDLSAARKLDPNPLKYFIDDLEVDQETFDRQLNADEPES